MNTLKDVQQQHILSSFIHKWREYTYCNRIKQRGNNMYKIFIYTKVLKQWDNFLNIVAMEKQYEFFVYTFQIKHIICNYFNQWRYQLNLIKIEEKLNAKFKHERVLNIFIDWKAQSENMMILRNKAKKYYDKRCEMIKNNFFILWDNLYQNEQSKNEHIEEWIINKQQNKCLLYLNQWKDFNLQRQQYKTQIKTAKIHFKHTLLMKGLQIFKHNHAIQNNIYEMDDDAIYFNIKSMRKHALSVWLQFISLNKKDQNLKIVGIQFKMYILIQFWRSMLCRNVRLRALKLKQCKQYAKHLVYRMFELWKKSWNNMQKSERFRKKSLSIKCLKIWRKSCIEKQIEIQKIVKCIQIVIIGRFYMKWNHVFKHRKHFFQIAMSCQKRRKFNLMKECYIEWNVQIIIQSKCKHIIDERAHKNALIIFHNWLNQSYSSQINRKAITHHNTKNIQMAWNEWKSKLILFQMNNEKAMRYFEKEIKPKLLTYNLSLWKVQSKRYKSTKIMMSIIDKHWKYQYVSFTLQKWSIFSKSQSRLKSIANSIAFKHNINAENNIFIEWRYQYMIVKHIKEIHKIKNIEMIKNYFASWKVFSHQEKVLRAKTTFIRMELRAIPKTKLLCEYQLGNIWKDVRSPIFRHFLSWKISWKITKKRENNQQIAISHNQMAVYMHCFNQLHNAFNDAKLMKKSFDHHRKYLMKIVLIEWKRNHLQRCHNQQLLKKASQFRNKQLLKQEINLWNKYNQDNKCRQKKGTILRNIINNKKITFVFLLWATSANKLQLNRNQTWTSYEFRAKTLKIRFFLIWLKQCRIDSSLRYRELQFVQVNNYKTMHDIFYKWCNTYNCIIYKADLLENHFNEICNYRLAKYFTIWLSVYNCTTNTRKRYLLSKIFTKWKHTSKRRNQFKKEIIHKPYIV